MKLCEVGRYDDAIKEIDKVIKALPAKSRLKALAFTERARCEGLKSEFSAAINDCDESLQTYKNAKANYIRGVSHVEMKHFSEAMADLEKVLNFPLNEITEEGISKDDLMEAYGNAAYGYTVQHDYSSQVSLQLVDKYKQKLNAL